MSRSFEEVVLPHLDAAFNYARWLTKNEADAVTVRKLKVDQDGGRSAQQRQHQREQHEHLPLAVATPLGTPRLMARWK